MLVSRSMKMKAVVERQRGGRVRIRLLIEGAGAAEAAEDLMVVPGVAIETVELRSTEAHKNLDAATVVAIITAIVGSAVTVADHIIRWRREHLANRTKVERVVIVWNGRRVNLDKLDAEELARLLRHSLGENPKQAD